MRKIIFILCCFVSQSLIAQGNWEILKTGAGGWITGMDVNPNSGLILAKSDVGGAYSYNYGANEWKQLVTAQSMPAGAVDWKKYQGVQSIVSAPSNSNRLYMAFDHAVYYSDNKGENWLPTNLTGVNFAPNDDESKLHGERLAVDPLDENIVYYGSIDQGLWRTTNGMDWSKINSIPNGTVDRGVRSISFDAAVNDGNKTLRIYVAVDGEGIYHSENGGNSWTKFIIPQIPNGNPQIFDMELASNGNLFICGFDEAPGGVLNSFGALRYDGTNWVQIFSEDLSIGYSELAVNRDNPNQVYLFSYGYSETYRTYNAGSAAPSWDYLTFDIQAPNIPWLQDNDSVWFTLGEVTFDAIKPNRIWISYGTGTFYSDDIFDSNMTWIEASSGQEHLVSNDAITMANGNILTAHWDFTMFLHDDQNQYPTNKLPTTRFNSAWDLDQSPSDPNFVVAVITDHRGCCFDNESRNSGYSEDAGQTWTQFASMPEGQYDLFYGTMAVSANDNDNIIWLPTSNRPPYYTTDKGQTWTAATLPGNSGNCCHDGFFFKRRALVADRVEDNTFYIYDWGAGHIFKTSDGGASWVKYDAVLPAWSFNAKILSVPGKAGHLFWVNGPEDAASLIEGIHHSTDGGQTWSELSNTDQILNIGIGKAKDNTSYPALFACGNIDGEYGYWQSDDEGSSWEKIGLYPTGQYEWPTVMEGDPHRYGRLIVGYAGNGFVSYQKASDALPPTISDHIHIDQFGYQPQGKKVAVLSNPQVGANNLAEYIPGNTLEIKDADTDAVVFSSSIIQWFSGATHDQSGDQGWWFDFSSLNTTGDYYVYDPENHVRSYEFKISEDVYNDILTAATRMFYYNRCNLAKEATHAGADWTDGISFTNSLQDANCRFIGEPMNASLEKDLTGGWFDAGDYNKYITFAHETLHNLLQAYQEHPMSFKDDNNIPESGNGIPDLLDEIKWELLWMQKMCNSDGSVHNKMGSINYLNGSSPPSINTEQRYYGPTCSSSSIAVASVFALASEVFNTIPGQETFASELLTTAELAWDYVLPMYNSNNLETDCDDGTINAGDADWNAALQKSNLIAASIYLYKITGAANYHDHIINNINDAQAINENYWSGYNMATQEALLLFTTIESGDLNTKNTILSSITNQVQNNWNDFLGFSALDLYRSHMHTNAYHWGSNLVKANLGTLNLQLNKYNIRPDLATSFGQKAEEQLHYFHGINPGNMVHLSNMYDLGGDNCVNEIYHGWFADGTDYDHALNSPKGPPPGYLVGGPNQSYSDDTSCPPYGQPAQKSILDFNTDWPIPSWEISEPAIYYQAAYIRLLAAYSESVDNPLPLNFLAFTLRADENDAVLNWQTSNEIDINKYEIERSFDFISWKKIGEVSARNVLSVSEYNYVDENILVDAPNDIVSYRIKILERNQSTSYSDTNSLDIIRTSTFEVFPNPASEEININLGSSSAKDAQISLLNSLGQVIDQIGVGNNQVKLEYSLKDLPNGCYLLLYEANGQRHTKKIIKE